MSSLKYTLAIAGLLGSTMFSGPLLAQSATRPSATPPSAAMPASPTAPGNQAAAGATETQGETVEQRITNLHMALKITPEQEANWKNVAQAMRENAAAMDRLNSSSRATQNMTALEDLATYQKFAQAHVDGLKNLIAAFEKLYAAMPATQKKIADDVFNAPASTRG